jgi:hypothetical protein
MGYNKRYRDECALVMFQLMIGIISIIGTICLFVKVFK